MEVPVCVILFCLLHTSQADPPDIREPPSVQKPSNGQLPQPYYKSAGTFILPCNATGIPAPTYRWTLNDQPVDPNQRNLKHLTEGSIEISDASGMDEGEYQCVASNKYGKSISQVFHLQRARLGGFPADKIIKQWHGVKGQSLKVQRLAITCVPNPTYNWKIVDDVDDNSPRELTKTRRVTQDLEGNLYFTSLTMQDELGGIEFYKVDVFNNVLDTTAGGSYSRVTVQDGPDVDHPAKLLYPEKNEITVVVLQGEPLKLQCIFGGMPSTTIQWTGPAKNYDIRDHDTTYVVETATRADEGTYTCVGRNRAGNDKATIHVDIQSIPKFTVNGKPSKRTLSEDDNVEFVCQTTEDTKPQATITWMVDVEPVDEKLPGKRTEIHEIKNGKVLSIVGLKREDIKVIQCKVSNVHKTLYADAPLNVLLRTHLVERPKERMVMENDTKVTFYCSATTDPSTKVTLNWTRDDKPIQFYDDPHIVKGEGMLTIYFNDSTMEERAKYAGRYGCNASNLYSWEFHEVELDFLNKPDDPNKRVKSASSLWWIILIIVLLLLLIIFFLICCTCCSRNKGGSYPVDEKERATGNDPIADLDKAGFHDYIRPPITKRKDSRASLTSTVFMGSTNSLAGIGDYSEGGMSEDGSFIGMYMDDRRKLKPSYSEA